MYNTVYWIINTVISILYTERSLSQNYVWLTPRKKQLKAMDPHFEVAWLFCQQYYTMMNKSPEKLHFFYNKKSSMTHGIEGEHPVVFHGQQVC
jgi:hypothetical protein